MTPEREPLNAEKVRFLLCTVEYVFTFPDRTSLYSQLTKRGVSAEDLMGALGSAQAGTDDIGLYKAILDKFVKTGIAKTIYFSKCEQCSSNNFVKSSSVKFPELIECSFCQHSSPPGDEVRYISPLTLTEPELYDSDAAEKYLPEKMTVTKFRMWMRNWLWRLGKMTKKFWLRGEK